MVGFPLLLIPLAVYNIIVFLMPGVSFTDPLLKLTLMSGAEWSVTLSDILLALGILLLLLEIIKGARPGAKYLTDHLLSFVVFAAAAAEFVLWPKFGSSTYFLLTLLALVDFLSGIALRARRRVAVVATAPVLDARAPAAIVPADERPVEPVHAPAPAPVPSTPSPATPTSSSSAVPPATSVAESVLSDHPEPTMAQPAALSPAAPHSDQPFPGEEPRR
jgi:hypothetical protein